MAAPSIIPTFCFLEGYLYKNNNPIVGLTIKIKPKQSFVNGECFFNHEWQTFDTTDERGYFGARIFESASVGASWLFKIGNITYEVIVPDATYAFWNDLTLRAV